MQSDWPRVITRLCGKSIRHSTYIKRECVFPQCFTASRLAILRRLDTASGAHKDGALSCRVAKTRDYLLHRCLTLRRLMSYIYGAPILDVSRSHTTTQHSR